MGVLQTPALPLGYVATTSNLEREMGLEPTAFSLARRRSTSELLPHAICYYSKGSTGLSRDPDLPDFPFPGRATL